MSGTTWNNVRGEVTIELLNEDGRVTCAHDDQFGPDCLVLLFADWAELVIEFTSSGFSDPGQRWGGPDGVGYPPEHNDERLFVAAYLLDENQQRTDLPADVQASVAAFYWDKIEAAELEDCCD